MVTCIASPIIYSACLGNLQQAFNQTTPAPVWTGESFTEIQSFEEPFGVTLERQCLFVIQEASLLIISVEPVTKGTKIATGNMDMLQSLLSPTGYALEANVAAIKAMPNCSLSLSRMDCSITSTLDLAPFTYPCLYVIQEASLLIISVEPVTKGTKIAPDNIDMFQSLLGPTGVPRKLKYSIDPLMGSIDNMRDTSRMQKIETTVS